MVKKKSGPPLTIKSVKSHGYTPAYEARLIRGIRKARKSGKKPTRQSARGHKKAEHIERKQKELAKNKISSSQIESVKSFLKRFNFPMYKGIPDEADLVDYIRNNGYESFVQYRKTWDRYRQEYLKAQRKHELLPSGTLGYNLMTIYGESGLGPPSDQQWLYYH